MRHKGWFKIPGVQDGDRTVQEQMTGLQLLLQGSEMHGIPSIVDKRVLDLGCAEGLIANELVKAGAQSVRGFEVVPEHVALAQRLHPGRLFVSVLDLNNTKKLRGILSIEKTKFDVALMLAILHKLKNPLSLVDSVLRQDPKLIVIRTAAKTPGYVKDERSDNKRYDFHPMLSEAKYALVLETWGPRDEWMGYYVKE